VARRQQFPYSRSVAVAVAGPTTTKKSIEFGANRRHRRSSAPEMAAAAGVASHI